MTTTKTPDLSIAEEATARTLAPDVPEVLTEEHHEAITRSWEMPAYTRQEAPVEPAKPSHKVLYAGLIAGGLGLVIGAGAGYVAGSQQATETVVRVPYAVTAPATPALTDANGLNMGRRLAPIDAQAPTALTAPVLTDANGLNMGRRLAPTETGS